MYPNIIKEFLYSHNEKQGCYGLAINNQQQIVQTFGNAKLLDIKPPSFAMLLVDYLPGILTEALDEDFEIPFYNITSNVVCNLYFLKHPELSYLLLIDKSEIFNVTQKYQQFAHEDNISKNKYKRLSKKLDKARHKLEKSNREKATLIAMLSHELGTPLTSILGYSELLLKNKTSCKKSIEIINRNAHYLKHMIENTLMFGSSEAQGLQAKIESLSIQSLLENLKEIMLPAAKHKNLSITIRFVKDEIIKIDITRTKQILINLLNNAVKYTEHGAIELAFSTLDNKYVFSVKDTGLGVPKKMRKDIFNPWKRIKANTEKGTGIGLFISQKLAETIGGTLKLRQSSSNKGSIFQLIIPVGQELEENKKEVVDVSICQGKRILVIDDDGDILVLIEALLETSKLKISTANSFHRAIEILKNEKIDTILIDFNLGIIKATDCIVPIREINNKIPILLMSAMPSKSLKDNYQEKGFAGVIAKPLNSSTMLKAITKTLENPHD